MGYRHQATSGGRCLSAIAFLTPLPPQQTGIADYAVNVLGALARRVEVDVYCAHRSSAPVPGVTLRRPSTLPRRYDRYDAVVAQVGNSPAHDWIVDAVRARPAAVVLHERVLHHLVAHLTLGRGRVDEYLALLEDCDDDIVAQALGAMSGRAQPVWETDADRYPLTAYVAESASHLLVHSHDMARSLQHAGGPPVTVVPFPAASVALPSSTHSSGGVTLGVFGFITPNKRLSSVMAAMRLASPRCPGLRLLVVGDSPAGDDPRRIARAAGVPDAVVQVENYRARGDYDALLAQVDIGVTLRHPTFGETSAATVDFLARDIPVIVSHGGWYDELPDAAVARVRVDDDEVIMLAATIEHLALDVERRRSMGAAAGEYARSVLSPDRTADAYLRALFASAGQLEVDDTLSRSLARSIKEVSARGGVETELIRHVVDASRSLDLMRPDA